MSQPNHSFIKQIAYKLPYIFKLVSLLSNNSNPEKLCHSKNIELTSNYFGFKSFASLNSKPLIPNESLFRRSYILNSLGDEEQYAMFYLILKNYLASLSDGIDNSKNLDKTTSRIFQSSFEIEYSGASGGDMWHSRSMAYGYCLSKQLLVLLNKDVVQKHIHSITINLSDSHNLLEFIRSLKELNFATRELIEYSEKLTNQNIKEQHGFISMILIRAKS